MAVMVAVMPSAQTKSGAAGTIKRPSDIDPAGVTKMSDNPYFAAVVGALQTMVHSSYAALILLGFVAVIVGSAIAFRDGSRVRRAEEYAQIELLRR